ncbi:MAG: SIS domain-containing protein [Devosia sp.]|nr:SIS domain-containing protein [Devosia sp.]
MSGLGEYLSQSAAVLEATIACDLAAPVEAAVDAIVAALTARRPLLVCGNGGSAADALHIAGELVGRFLAARKAYNVIALPANPAIVTAWGNDHGFDSVYARQVEAHGAPGAVLLAISTSGDSPNIVRAAEQARAEAMTVVALTGAGGGALARHADILIAVPATATPMIQQVHVCLYHYLCQCIEARLAGA